ncbi:uncharacterized protein LOC112574784 [Pomacea canaliculata]|uniref:uncharacterized protein LOC112574784 n=1 Tax=Pomacea canaliculata TaxID=400727 RepID=UPI000D72529F|nr:uncharacterized protein LOC112574784 [Pomacea canaliculata]
MAGIEFLIKELRLLQQEARYTLLDQLNFALTGINPEDRGKVEEKKKEILVFCKAETEKTLCNQDQQEIGDWLDKIAETGVNREAREKVWFKYAQQVYWNLEEFNKNKNKMKLQTDDISGIFKPPNDLFLTAFLLLGENQSELSKWQEIWTKLNQTNANQLLEKLTKFDDSVLSGEQLDLAEKTFMGCNGRFHQCDFHKRLYEWCFTRVACFPFLRMMRFFNT